jgi:hypothetical protein
MQMRGRLYSGFEVLFSSCESEYLKSIVRDSDQPCVLPAKQSWRYLLSAEGGVV